MWKLFALAGCLLFSGSVVEGIDCPSGWSTFGAICLRYSGSTNQNSGNSICNNYGGRLIQPVDKSMSDLLASVLPANNVGWLGIFNNRYLGGTNNGQPITFSLANYQVSGAAVLQSTKLWLSSGTSNRLIYCELPRTNTECPSVNTIFVEDSFPSLNSETCRQACAATNDCTFWTFNDGQCSLKNYPAGALVEGGGFGSRTGFPNHEIPTTGKVLVAKAFENVANPAECQKMCRKDHKCKSITFTIQSGTQDCQSNCVFNYGETKRKITVPSNGNIVSAPACCKHYDDCDKNSFSVTTEITSNKSPSSGKEKKEKEVTFSDKELEKFKKELDEAISRANSTSS